MLVKLTPAESRRRNGEREKRREIQTSILPFHCSRRTSLERQTKVFRFLQKIFLKYKKVVFLGFSSGLWFKFGSFRKLMCSNYFVFEGCSDFLLWFLRVCFNGISFFPNACFISYILFPSFIVGKSNIKNYPAQNWLFFKLSFHQLNVHLTFTSFVWKSINLFRLSVLTLLIVILQ